MNLHRLAALLSQLVPPGAGRGSRSMGPRSAATRRGCQPDPDCMRATAPRPSAIRHLEGSPFWRLFFIFYHQRIDLLYCFQCFTSCGIFRLFYPQADALHPYGYAGALHLSVLMATLCALVCGSGFAVYSVHAALTGAHQVSDLYSSALLLMTCSAIESFTLFVCLSRTIILIVCFFAHHF